MAPSIAPPPPMMGSPLNSPMALPRAVGASDAFDLWSPGGAACPPPAPPPLHSGAMMGSPSPIAIMSSSQQQQQQQQQLIGSPVSQQQHHQTVMATPTTHARAQKKLIMMGSPQQQQPQTPRVFLPATTNNPSILSSPPPLPDSQKKLLLQRHQSLPESLRQPNALSPHNSSCRTTLQTATPINSGGSFSRLVDTNDSEMITPSRARLDTDASIPPSSLPPPSMTRDRLHSIDCSQKTPEITTPSRARLLSVDCSRTPVSSRSRSNTDASRSNASLPQSSMPRSRVSTESSSQSQITPAQGQTIPGSISRGRLDTTDSAVTLPHFNHRDFNASPRKQQQPETDASILETSKRTTKVGNLSGGGLDSKTNTRAFTNRLNRSMTQQQQQRNNIICNNGRNNRSRMPLAPREGGDDDCKQNTGISDAWLVPDKNNEQERGATDRSHGTTTWSVLLDDNKNNNEPDQNKEGTSDSSPGFIKNELGVMDNGTFSDDDDASSIIFTYVASKNKNGRDNNAAFEEMFDENKAVEELALELALVDTDGGNNNNSAISNNNSLLLQDLPEDGELDNVEMAAAAAAMAMSTVKERNVMIDRLPSNLGQSLENDDDAASDMSSLSDTVNYQQQLNNKNRGRKEKRPSLSGSGSNSNSSSSYKPASSMAVMAALLKPKSLRKLQSSRRFASHEVVRDTVTTAGTTSIGKSMTGLSFRTNHTLETIDQSLENRMLTKEMQKHESQRGRLLFDHSIVIPSPLDAELNRETSMRSFAGNHSLTPASGRSSHHRRVRTHVGWATGPHNNKCEGAHPHHRRTPSGGSSSNRGHRYSTSLDNNEFSSNIGPQGGWFRNSREYGGGGHGRSNSNGSGAGIQGSWLVPSPGKQNYHSLPLDIHQQIQIDTPKAGEDLIDVSKDEPIDPFSGLIGMPSAIGCESVASGDALGDGGSYSGLNVFGNAPKAASSGHSPKETCSLRNADQITPLAFRPPTGRRSKSTTFDEFDPLIEEELMNFPLLNSDSVGTPLRHPMAAVLPPRHHRDDPLLSKSRYRSPLQQAAEAQKHQPKSSKRLSPHLKHRKSASLGGICPGGLGFNANTCMFGSIANMEATKTPVTPLGMTRNTSLTSLEWDGSIGPSIGGGASLGHSIGRTPTLDTLTPGSVSGEQQVVFPTPNPAEGSPTSENNKPEEEGDDDSSYGSFSEELRRPEPKRKIVKNEFKHLFGKVLPIGKPVVKAGRKLMGRKNDGPGLKRAEGCLT